MGHSSPESQGAAPSEKIVQNTKTPPAEKLLPKPGEAVVLPKGANQENIGTIGVSQLPKFDDVPKAQGEKTPEKAKSTGDKASSNPLSATEIEARESTARGPTQEQKLIKNITDSINKLGPNWPQNRREIEQAQHMLKPMVNELFLHFENGLRTHPPNEIVNGRELRRDYKEVAKVIEDQLKGKIQLQLNDLKTETGKKTSHYQLVCFR